MSSQAERIISGIKAINPAAHLPSPDELDALRERRNPNGTAWIFMNLPTAAVLALHRWQIVQMGEDGYAAADNRGLRVIASGATEADGKRWLHVSLSRSNALPSYDDMCRVKRIFLGEQSYAFQVFPPKNKHVNLMPFCLHLWCCMEGSPLPDFTAGYDTV